jgi:hypothetical protein
MDIPPQVVLIAKRILRELETLRETVKAKVGDERRRQEIGNNLLAGLRILSAAVLGIQKQVDSVAKDRQAQKESKSPAPELVAILDSLQGTQAEQRASSRSQDLYQKRDLFISWAGVLVLLAYTIVNFGMLCAMRDANKTASDSFAKTLCQMQAQTVAQQKAASSARSSADAAVSASRPWIVPIKELQYLNAPTPIYLSWRNLGKTPAFHVSATAEYALGWAPKGKETCEQLRRTSNWGGGLSMILPDSSYSFVLQNLPKKWEEPLGEEGVRRMTIHGCVWYTDVLANAERTTEFCYQATWMSARIFAQVTDPQKLPTVTIASCGPADAFILK